MKKEERNYIYVLAALSCFAVLAVTCILAISNHNEIVALKANQHTPCACEEQISSLTKRVEAAEWSREKRRETHRWSPSGIM